MEQMLNNLVIQYGALGLLVGILLVVSWRFYKHMLAEHKTLKEEIKVLRENENKKFCGRTRIKCRRIF